MLDIVLQTPECEPHVGSKEAAGMDLRLAIKTAAGFTALSPGESISFSTGVKIEIPIGWVGLVAPRSGLGCKYKIVLDNTIGFIDSDYRGWIKVSMTNRGSETAFIGDYDRVCQLVIVPHYLPTFRVVDELSKTTRGSGGFGHTGTQ
jgi:dUTP pyrophosphatase